MSPFISSLVRQKPRPLFSLMAIIKQAKKSFDGMYDTKTMIMIASITTIVKRLIGKQIQKKPVTILDVFHLSYVRNPIIYYQNKKLESQ